MLRWSSKKTKPNRTWDGFVEVKTEQEILDELAYNMDIQIVKQIMLKEGGMYCHGTLMTDIEEYLECLEKSV